MIETNVYSPPLINDQLLDNECISVAKLSITHSEYLSKKDNNILTKILYNSNSNPEYLIEKTTEYIRITYVETDIEQIVPTISIYISELSVNPITNLMHPSVYIEYLNPACTYNPFNYINIKLSKIVGKNNKFLYGSNELSSICDNNIYYWTRFLNDNNFSSSNISPYLELVYYCKQLIKSNHLNSNHLKSNHLSSDDLGVYNEYNEYNKSTIDFINLTTQLNNSKIVLNNYNSIVTKDFKDLLYSRKQIVNMIISQLKSINQNKEYLHYINNSDNAFEFYIYIITTNKTEIKLQLNIDPDLFPFYPPTLKIISPNVKLNLLTTINNLDILKLENWNPTITLEWLVINLANNLDNIDEYIFKSTDTVIPIEKEIIELSILNGTYNFIPFNFDYNKFQLNDNKTSKYWKSGTGYGHNGNSQWNINDYIKKCENENELKCNKLKTILSELEQNNTPNIETLLLTSSNSLLTFITSIITNTTLLEINNNIQIYTIIINIIPVLFNILSSNATIWKTQIYETIKIINKDTSLILQNNPSNINTPELTLYDSIFSLFNILDEKSEFNINLKEPPSILNSSKIIDDKIVLYNKMVSEYQRNIFTDYIIQDTHIFSNQKSNNIDTKSILRITSELASLKTNLPNNWDTSVILRASKQNLNIFTFIITGPKDTPYHNGIFEFHGYLENKYPSTTPKIILNTTGNGTVRFNPNLYNCGKVCLSLLGTWRGDASENWNSTSTLLQVFVSIQSLIFVENPYYNEPGWETQMHTTEGNTKSFKYTDNIRIETLRWGIIDKIKNPTYGFEEFTKNHFLLKKDETISVIDIWIQESNRKNELVKLQTELIELLV
jgi:ubiquitin-protein ligase